MSALLILAIAWAGAAVAFALAWRWQRAHRDIGIVDACWSACVGGAAVLAGALGAGAAWPRATVALLGGLWGLRLALHIWRRLRASGEDGRYVYLRKVWQDDQRRILAFFLAQSLLVPLFALPFVAVAANAVDGPGPWWIAGVAVWCAAVAGEAIADRQLARFRADPANRGRTCRDGLWRYSRHPNYFFEWLHWFAYIALAVGSPLFALALAGPVVMFVFLRWLSGVPWTERQALRTRGDDYAAYVRTTPMFFPWFPKPDDRDDAEAR